MTRKAINGPNRPRTGVHTRWRDFAIAMAVGHQGIP